MVASLREVGEEGYDLEIRDADGRRTYHGIMNENSIDRQYLEGAPNGFNGLMAAGIVNALAYVSGRSDDRYFAEEILLEERRLLGLARDTINLLDLGAYTNFSGYNMAFISAFLATRYIREARFRSEARAVTARLSTTWKVGLDNPSSSPRRSTISSTPRPCSEADLFPASLKPSHERRFNRKSQILREFPEAPFFPEPRFNCDEDEVASLDCIAEDGTPLPLLGPVGWNDELVAAVPVPMRLRPPSNFIGAPIRIRSMGTVTPFSSCPPMISDLCTG